MPSTVHPCSARCPRAAARPRAPHLVRAAITHLQPTEAGLRRGLRTALLVLAFAGGPAIAGAQGNPATAASKPAGPDGPLSGQLRAANVIDTGAWRGQPMRRVEDLLVGRVAGVDVIPTAGGYAVRVRGAASLVGGAEPLYLVDGMPVTPTGPGTLSGINPADIVRIEVLKNAADLTFYGVRGANGVIRITTKRPGSR